MRTPAAVLAAGLVLGAPCAVRAEEAERSWAFGVSLQGYDVPDTEDFLVPAVTADRGHLHLEGRYQYEALDTTSLWVGANFTAGESWTFDATLMLGAVFGDIDGVAPGYRIALTHGWFSLDSEGEYFASTRQNEDNFLYNWSQVSASPLSWFRVGLAAQRTRAYENGLSVQRGPFVGFTVHAFDVAAYALNPFGDDRVYTAILSYEF